MEGSNEVLIMENEIDNFRTVSESWQKMVDNLMSSEYYLFQWCSVQFIWTRISLWHY